MPPDAVETLPSKRMQALARRYLVRVTVEIEALCTMFAKVQEATPEEVRAILMQLAHVTHQTYGASAMFGFPALSECAGVLNEFITTHQKTTLTTADCVYIQQQLTHLAALAAAARGLNRP